MKAGRQQQNVEELCGASIRALTGQADLHYQGRYLYKGAKLLALRAPHLRTDPVTDDFNSYRGASDGISLRLQLSNPNIYNQYQPEHSVQQFVYEILEQLRVESLVPGYFPGMKRNLRHRFESWSLSFHRARLTETHVGILLYTLTQVAWSRFNSCAVISETENLMEATRFLLMPLIGTSLYALKKNLNDQKLFAQHALEIASIVHGLIDSETVKQLEVEDAALKSNEITRLARFISLDAGDELNSLADTLSGESKVFRGGGHRYRVFSRQYDRVIEAATQVRKEVLPVLRKKLDLRIKGQGVNIPRLARKLSLLLSTPYRDGWNFGEEDGFLDAGRLSQLVSSPSETRVYQLEKIKPVANSQVSVLIDCSGSMKSSIESVAVLIDILARAMEQAGVSTEILGYTTLTWNGGRCQNDWMAQGRPKNPGRLNEICHLIYKSSDSTWRRSRRDVAALLKPDLFREGIDGEAIEWACQRMLDRPEPRKILIVISDGCPMDTATNLANDQFYLDNHLRQVIDEQVRRSEIEIYGLGVGVDLSPYYSHSLALDLSQTLSNQVFEEILQLLAGRHHR